MPSLWKFDQLFSKERKDSGWTVRGTQPKHLNNVNTVARAARTDSFAWRHADNISETRAPHDVDRSNAILFVLWQKGHGRFSIGSFMGTHKKYSPKSRQCEFLSSPAAQRTWETLCVALQTQTTVSGWIFTQGNLSHGLSFSESCYLISV